MLFVVLMSLFVSLTRGASRPNIIFILADDLGWNDVGFHGSLQIPTPNIDALASSGIILNNYYVQPVCTPSRATLMTGKYPIHTGMQHDVIYAGEPWGMPPEDTILPQHLNTLGYKSHMVGKWHLGFYNTSYLPTYRGFHSHFGYWNGEEDYFTHIKTHKGASGYDFRRDMDVAVDVDGTYSTTALSTAAVDIINKHDTSEPLFLYLPHQATHAPLQAPEETIAKFNYIKDEKRRHFAGMLFHLDLAVGELFEALSAKNILNNTIIVFSTDNGGPAAGYNGNHASNWPLRSVKRMLWEGGVRAAGFIWSPLLQTQKRVSTQMIHISDWLPTLYRAAGGDVKDLKGIDGIDIWDALSQNLSSPRNEMLLNIDGSSAALRYQNFKLIQGSNSHGHWDGWYGPSGRNETDPNASENWSNSKVYTLLNSDGLLDLDDVERIRSVAEVLCGPVPPDAKDNCNPGEAPCLYDIAEDPCEYHNIAEENPEMLQLLQKKLAAYTATAVPKRNKHYDEKSNPEYYDHVWVNWGDYEI